MNRIDTLLRELSDEDFPKARLDVTFNRDHRIFAARIVDESEFGDWVVLYDPLMGETPLIGEGETVEDALASLDRLCEMNFDGERVDRYRS
jgi:hypothetical protein